MLYVTCLIVDTNVGELKELVFCMLNPIFLPEKQSKVCESSTTVRNVVSVRGTESEMNERYAASGVQRLPSPADRFQISRAPECQAHYQARQVLEIRLDVPSQIAPSFHIRQTRHDDEENEEGRHHRQIRHTVCSMPKPLEISPQFQTMRLRGSRLTRRL